MVDKKSTLKSTTIWLLKMIEINWKSANEYKESFLIQIIGMIINNIGIILGWYFVFKIFGDINGWTIKEYILIQGIVAIEYGIVSFFSKGTLEISRKATMGVLDKYLVQPKNILLNISFSEYSLSAAGDFVFGILATTLYFFISDINPVHLFYLPIILTIATILYWSCSLIWQSIVFWLPNSEDISDTLYHSMLGLALYPNTSLSGTPKLIFTYIIPAIAISTIPASILISPNIKDIFLIISLTIIWFILSIYIFYKGLKRYESGNLVGRI